MKTKRYLLTILLMTIFFCYQAKPQTGTSVPVEDVKAWYQRLSDHIKAANQWVNENIANSQMIMEARKRLQQLDSTKQVLNETYDFYRKVERDLEKVYALKDMKIADLQYINERLLGESLNPSDYIPNNKYTYKLRASLNHDTRKTVDYTNKELYRDIFDYHELNDYDPNKLQAIADTLESAKILLEIEQILATIETCNKTIEMCQEQQKYLLTDKKLKMSQGERLSALNSTSKMMLEALNLRHDAENRLITIKQEGLKRAAFVDFRKQQEEMIKTAIDEVTNINHPNKLKLRNHFSLWKYGKTHGKI